MGSNGNRFQGYVIDNGHLTVMYNRLACYRQTAPEAWALAVEMAWFKKFQEREAPVEFVKIIGRLRDNPKITEPEFVREMTKMFQTYNDPLELRRFYLFNVESDDPVVEKVRRFKLTNIGSRYKKGLPELMEYAVSRLATSDNSQSKQKQEPISLEHFLQTILEAQKAVRPDELFWAETAKVFIESNDDEERIEAFAAPNFHRT